MRSAKPKLNDTNTLVIVQKNNPEASSGIVLLSVTPPENISDFAVLIVSADEDLGIEPVQFQHLPQYPFTIGLHTHFLTKGMNKIRFTIIEGAQELYKNTINIPSHLGSGLAPKVKQLLQTNGTPLAFMGSCDSDYYPYNTGKDSHPWFDRDDADEHIAALLKNQKINTQEAEQLRQFVRDGYLIAEGLIDDAFVDAVNKEIDDAVAKGYQGYQIGSSQRIELLHQHYPNIRKLWLHQIHRRLTSLLFDAPARPCQTLVYLYGSQQDAHQDIIHLTPFPAGYMCGIWISLQDVVPDSGELVVYPGSHRAKRIYMKDTGCQKVKNADWSEFGEKVVPRHLELAKNYKPFIYRPKKGTVLIWHENLLHGGSVRINQSLQRRSIVIHSFADGAIVYYDSTGLAGGVASDKDMAAA